MTEPDVVLDAYSHWIDEILETHARRSWEDPESDPDDTDPNGRWDGLPEYLQDRLWGLSADLFSLVDNETFADADWEPSTRQELATLLDKAFRNGRWDELLVLLRRPPRFLEKVQVSWLRGRAWQGLGKPRIALKFFDNAARLRPGYATYDILGLECLKEARDWPEAISRANRYSHEITSSSALLFRAADVLLAYSMTGIDNQAEIVARALEIVDQGFEKMASPGAEEPLTSTLLAAHVTRAFCLERIGRIDDALRAYDEAIQRLPGNSELHTARGLLRLEHGHGVPTDDFEEAVNLDADSVTPYLELGLIRFSQSDYPDVIALCRAGLNKARRDSDAALLFNLLGCALFQSQAPREAVASAFETAVSLDPFNLSIQANQERFLEISGRSAPSPPSWELGPRSIEEERQMLYQAVQPALLSAA